MQYIEKYIPIYPIYTWEYIDDISQSIPFSYGQRPHAVLGHSYKTMTTRSVSWSRLLLHSSLISLFVAPKRQKTESTRSAACLAFLFSPSSEYCFSCWSGALFLFFKSTPSRAQTNMTQNSRQKASEREDPEPRTIPVVPLSCLACLYPTIPL